MPGKFPIFTIDKLLLLSIGLIYLNFFTQSKSRRCNNAGFDLEYPNTTYLIITYILLLVFIIISSLVYFRGHNVKAGLGQGIWLGIIFILVGMVLDAIITIPLFMNFDYSFLIRGNILIGSAVILVVCSVVGLLKK